MTSSKARRERGAIRKKIKQELKIHAREQKARERLAEADREAAPFRVAPFEQLNLAR